MKKILILLNLFFVISFVYAQSDNGNDLYIIPEKVQDVESKVLEIGGEGGKVMDKYKDAAYGKIKDDGSRTREGSNMTLGEQFASGIMTRDTLLDYVVYIVRFLLQLGLLIGAIVFIYLGYGKMVEFLKGGNTSPIEMVIIGLLVIIFAYVIMKTLYNMFLS